MRRACQEGLALLRKHSRNADLVSEVQRRVFSSLPEDIAQAAQRAKFPSRRQPPNSFNPAAAEGPSTSGSSAASVNSFQEGAKIASTWMFPWERRQLEGAGTALRPWEKAYWGIFVVAVSIFLFNRLAEKKVEEPDNTEEKERKKEEMARLVLAGQTTLVPWGEEDVFEGMAPEELQQYVEKVTGASSKDPFEGMDPAEIDAYVKQHGLPGTAA